MICVESDAWQFACPRTIGEAGADSAGGCVGSKCMAWQWMRENVRANFHVATETTAETEPARPAEVPESWTFTPCDRFEGDPAGWAEPIAEAMRRERGYCGLAGEPRCVGDARAPRE